MGIDSDSFSIHNLMHLNHVDDVPRTIHDYLRTLHREIIFHRSLVIKHTRQQEYLKGNVGVEGLVNYTRGQNAPEDQKRNAEKPKAIAGMNVPYGWELPHISTKTQRK